MENFPEEKTYKSHRKNSIVTFVLLAAVIYMATIQVKAWWSEQSAIKVTPRAVAPRGDLGDDEKETIKLFEETSPSVVLSSTSTFLILTVGDSLSLLSDKNLSRQSSSY